MKNLIKNSIGVLFLALISMSLLTTSCKKDDDDLDEIVGTWKLHEVEMKILGVTTTVPPSQIGMDITVVINADKTYTATIINTSTSKTETETGTWNRTDNTTVVITPTGDGKVQTLIKEGGYYIVNDTHDGNAMKMKYKKQ